MYGRSDSYIRHVIRQRADPVLRRAFSQLHVVIAACCSGKKNVGMISASGAVADPDRRDF